MSTKRIKSIESNIYHRPTCKYIGFMKPGNRETLLLEDVKYHGYCACRHCNNMSFLCSSEKKTIEWNKKYSEHGIQIHKRNFVCEDRYGMLETGLFQRYGTDCPVSSEFQTGSFRFQAPGNRKIPSAKRSTLL